MAKVNSEKLKKMFKEKNLMQVSISRALGFSDNYISSRLSEGEIPDDRLEKICMVLNISPESVKLEKDPQKTDGGVTTLQEKDIISYICDVGKILTDLLRETKELHDDTKAYLTALNTNIIDSTTELRQVGETVRNHSVATNQNMNKMHNLMKYGGK